MKGIVLSLGLPRKRRIPDIRLILKRHGITLLLASLLLAGLVLGVVYSRCADKSTLQSLDFLFTTNLDARLSQGVIGIFCACFASDFLFLLGVYLLGIAAWGIPFIAALLCFKGLRHGCYRGLAVRYARTERSGLLSAGAPSRHIHFLRVADRLFGTSVRVFKACFFYSLSRQTPAASS